VPVLATFFTVRRGRDPFFKFFMKSLFPKQVDRYQKEFGMRFLGWYNVAYGWDFDNVILLELPDYSTIDKLRATLAPVPSAIAPVSGCSSATTPCSCASDGSGPGVHPLSRHEPPMRHRPDGTPSASPSTRQLAEEGHRR